MSLIAAATATLLGLLRLVVVGLLRVFVLWDLFLFFFAVERVMRTDDAILLSGLLYHNAII
jgi:hypothetical protein